MKLNKDQAHEILKTLHCDDDFVKSKYGNTVKNVVKNSPHKFASKIHIRYWHHGKLKRGSLFSLVNDRLVSHRLYFKPSRKEKL